MHGYPFKALARLEGAESGDGDAVEVGAFFADDVDERRHETFYALRVNLEVL